VGKSGSRFDPEKAKWFNARYLQMKSDDELTNLFMHVVNDKGFNPEREELKKIVSLVKERVSFVRDMWHEADFFFIAPETYDNDVVKKKWNEDSPRVIAELRDIIFTVDPFRKENIEHVVREWTALRGYTTGAVFALFRLMIVGAARGPLLFDIVEWIGREEAIRRLDNGLKRLA
jgi:glutamyl-tRNA synthetase